MRARPCAAASSPRNLRGRFKRPRFKRPILSKLAEQRNSSTLACADLRSASRSGGEAHRQLSWTVADRRHPRLRLAGGLEPPDVPRACTEQRLRFVKREHTPDTRVNAVPPADVPLGVAADIEAVGVAPLARIAVCG